MKPNDSFQPLRFSAPLLRPPHPLLQAIEVASRLQLPGIQIIGLPGPEVAEARERIGAALESIGSGALTRRIILNLTPAALRKRGTSADLAMALACLSALHPKTVRAIGHILALGELGLQGEIKRCEGLAATLLLATQNGVRWVLLPSTEVSSAHAALRAIAEIADAGHTRLPQILGFTHLREAWEWIQTGTLPHPSGAELEPIPRGEGSPHEHSLALYRLTPLQERWAGILASGRHHALVLGVRGSGKSHFLEWVAALRGPLSAQQALWRWSQGLQDHVRNPEGDRQSGVRRALPEITPAALLGSVAHGNDRVRIGELTLAHGGVLIANEFLEWKRPARECLREPLESGEIHLSSAQGHLQLPARFQLLASANWCECGDADQPDAPCRCSPHQKRTYWTRLSGPLLERLDFCMGLSRTEGETATQLASRAEIQSLRTRVHLTQTALRARWGCLPGEPGSSKSAEFWSEQKETLASAERLLQPATEERELSRRSQHQILRLAASIHAWDSPNSTAPWSDAAIREATLYRRQIEQWTRVQ